MIFKEFQGLVNESGSRYGLVIAVTKRARDLKDGQPSLVNHTCSKAVSVAIKELVDGKITIVNNA